MTMTPEQRREIARRGGLARAAQFTPESQRAAGKARARSFDRDYQAAASARVTREGRQKAGRASFDALVRKCGSKEAAMERLAQYRREHPSCLERTVMAWLDANGIPYEHEVCVAGWWCDFVVGNTVIEVDGEAWHTNTELHGEDRKGRDALKDMALAANGKQVVRLSEADVKSGAFEQQLSALGTSPFN